MTWWETYYHLIWATRLRHPLLDDAGATIVERSFRRTCQEAGILVRSIGIMPDHVHLAISIPPRWAVSIIVRDLKVSATHASNNASALPYAGSFGWQREFGVFTFGAASLDAIVSYVDHQREHHASNTLIARYERIAPRDTLDEGW